MACITVKQMFWPLRETTNCQKVTMFGEGTAIGVRTLLQQV